MKCNFAFSKLARLTLLLTAAAAFPVFAPMSVGACGDLARLAADKLAREAISTNEPLAAAAVAQLRALGPEGLDALFRVHKELLEKSEALALLGNLVPRDATFDRVQAVVDAVGQQRDCAASHLYWHTDLEQAQAEARKSGKPILSLRLLGNLNEEFSCANSRFFRSTLYANRELSACLRDNFVLHWKSVRPVPRVTIDFGDGRRLERTVTGNSIHYILDSQGRVLDALPGLYGAQAFRAGLERAAQLAKDCATLDNAKRAEALRQYHESQNQAVAAAWRSELLKVHPEWSARPAVWTLDELRRDTDASDWVKLAAFHQTDAQLDEGARRLMRRQHPSAADAGRPSISKRIVEDPMLRVIQSFERSAAEDTVRNEYTFHTKIHTWLAAETGVASLDKFNSRVYAELFLTPDSDPWLGLSPADAYTALAGNGRVQLSDVQSLQHASSK